MSGAQEVAFVARPAIISIVAEACYNDPDARLLADKESLVDYADADPSTQEFWRFIAAAALTACAHLEVVDVLQQFVNGVETRMIDSPADETLANITRRAKAALTLARGETA